MVSTIEHMEPKLDPSINRASSEFAAAEFVKNREVIFAKHSLGERIGATMKFVAAKKNEYLNRPAQPIPGESN